MQTAFVDARASVNRVFDTFFVPPTVESVDVWADENRVLPKETSAESGPWRTDRTPYARQIMRDLSDDSPYEDIVLMCSTQLVKSETGLNWLGSIIDQTPAPMMIVQATVDTAKRYSRQRVGPMIAACPTLRHKVKDSRSRDSGNTLQMKEFPGGVLVITGANSAAGLASMPARFIHFDERDDYPDDVDGQGEPTRIARARQDTFFRRKRLISSSPKRPKGESRIESDFQSGTRFYFEVPCPHCDAEQRLNFEHLSMAGDAAVYTCPHCGADVDEYHKNDMLAAGKWVAENPGAKVRSYHLNSLYSPLGWLSWQALLEEYDEAKLALDRGDDAPMKAFKNTRLAETFEEKTDKVDGGDLKDRAEDYPLREVHRRALLLTAGVDVQDNRFEISVYAWGPQEESWIVDHAILFADPSQKAAWDKLDDYLQSTFESTEGLSIPIEAAAVDTGGHFTHEVYAFTRRRRRYFAVKGAERPGLPVKGKSSLQDVNWQGKIIPKGVRLHFVGTDSAKDLLHNRLRMKREGAGYIHLCKELSDDFFEGMTSEHRVKVKTARGIRSAWAKKKGNGRNEPWDCAVYALFAAHSIDVPRYTEKMWEIRRKLLARRKEPHREPATPSAIPVEAESAEPGVQQKLARVHRPPRARRGGFVSNW